MSTSSINTLWAALASLMKQHYGGENQNRLSRAAGVGVATINRIKAGKTSVGLDVVDKLAGAFGLAPWQLLSPAFDAAGQRRELSPMALDLGRNLDAIQDADMQRKAYAIALQVVSFGTPPAQPAQSAAPEGQANETTAIPERTPDL